MRVRIGWILLITLLGATAVVYLGFFKTRIDHNRTYIIGFGHDRPLHFADKNGNPAGLAVSIVREAARRRGIRLQWQQSNHPGVQSVHNGEVDMWVMVADLPERHQIAHLTEPYIVTEYCLLVDADSPYRKAADLATARIAYAGFTAERIMAKPLFPRANLIATGSPGGAFDALVRGEADAALLDQYAAGDLALSGDRAKKMRIVPMNGGKYYMSLAVNFKIQAVGDEIRDEIRQMAAEGTLTPYFEGWGFFPGLNLEAMDSLSRARARERALIAGVSALVLLLGYTVALVNRLRRQRFRLESVLIERDQAEKENIKLQTRLHQANKMESVGRLAGGIAHDFNNLLTVINGYSGMLLNRFKQDDPALPMVKAIHNAGQRATGLTSQLLALSRKQTIKPKTMDLNAVVRDLQKVLDRVIGEDIDVLINLDPELGNLVADPDQIHQVLMNLVVNGRDAMPSGGTLTIETRNADVDQATAAAIPDANPGRYVLLKVSDSGVGMSHETRQNVFEPFFTTKEPGKGTGLGLSTAYGIVTQAGGWIDVQSEEGKGTEFLVYLPRTDALTSSGPSSLSEERQHGGETVLLVEDQDFVRRFAQTVLESYGYRVLTAAGGKEACELASNYTGEIHLLLTDVILRGMNGKTLSESLLLVRPKLRVLFMSGYPADVISRRGMLEPGLTYIQKPFTPDAMAAKVQEALSNA